MSPQIREFEILPDTWGRREAQGWYFLNLSYLNLLTGMPQSLKATLWVCELLILFLV